MTYLCFLHRPWLMTESPETFSYDWWRKYSFAFWLHCPLSVGDPARTDSLLKDCRRNWAATWTFIISERKWLFIIHRLVSNGAFKRDKCTTSINTHLLYSSIYTIYCAKGWYVDVKFFLMWWQFCTWMNPLGLKLCLTLSQKCKITFWIKKFVSKM